MADAVLLASQFLAAVVALASFAVFLRVLVRPGTGSRRAWIPALASVALSVSIALQSVGAPSPWDGFLLPLALPLLLSTYPDGHFVPRWLVLPVSTFLLAPIIFVASAGAVAGELWWSAWMLAGLLLVAPTVVRYRRRRSRAEREHVRFALLGFVIGTELILGLVTVALFSGHTDIAAAGPIAVAAANLAGVIVASGFVFGLARPTWFDVDQAFRLVVIVSGCAITLSVAFASVMALLGGTSASNWVGAAVVAVLTVPAALLSTRIANWMVYGRRPNVEALVTELGRRFDRSGDPGSAVDIVAELVHSELGLVFVELTGRGLPTVRLGTPVEQVEEHPIQFNDEPLALLRVSPRGAESVLSPRDRAAVRGVAIHAAPALHGARVFAELVEARAGLIRAQEEERKRLRSDLHDDLAPTLAGLGFGAGGIAELSRDRMPDVADIATALLADIQEAIRRTREIAYGLRPPILDDHGLVAAILDRTRAHTHSALQIAVHAQGDEHLLPAAVELAALRIVQEAVTNVRKHADAHTCRVDLDIRPDRLLLTVTDDGRGLPAQPRAGLGLASIRTRARELGGRASVSTAPGGGTRLVVSLPTSSVVGVRL